MVERMETELADLRAEVWRLRQALWEVLVAVDELAYVVEFSRDQEIGTKNAVEAVDRARDILTATEGPRARARAQGGAVQRAAVSKRRPAERK